MIEISERVVTTDESERAQVSTPACARTFQIGVSRPPLLIEDLPTPEMVFAVRNIGWEELILFVLGPSVVALGLAIGSGEWLLGPLSVGRFGFTGIGWVILCSAVLQTFYNVELARFTIATGEPSIVAFGRTPPGYLLWIPLALVCFYLPFVLGGWGLSAGCSLFALFNGRAPLAGDQQAVRNLSVILMLTTFCFLLFGRKIERMLELFQGVVLTFVFVGLIVVTATVVPVSYWAPALLSLITPARIPKGADVSLLSALAGFTALASGLNYMITGLYRDKGYGMGHKAGYLASLFGGGRKELSPHSYIFPEDAKNASCWKRWFRYLLIDQWGIFFTGSIVGMMAPCILVGYLAHQPGAAPPTNESMIVYCAVQLGKRYGYLMFGWALLTGFLLLYKAQIGILDLLARNLTDAVVAAGPRFLRRLGADPRPLYYSSLFLLVIVIIVLINTSPPVDVIINSANLTNLAALIFPAVLIYLNRQLPRPARITWWSYLALAANIVFFGFFFVNFVALRLTGSPLVRF
jgi:hypothetical protein